MIKILSENYVKNNYVDGIKSSVLLVALIDTSTNKVKSFAVTGKALKKYLSNNIKPIIGLWKLDKKYELFK